MRNRLDRIKSGNKKNSSETVVVNHMRHDVTQMSIDAIKISYMGRLKTCFRSSTDNNWIQR